MHQVTKLCPLRWLPADMAPVYEAVCQEQGWEVDQAQLARMAEANAKRLQELEEKISDAGAACPCTWAARCSLCVLCCANRPAGAAGQVLNSCPGLNSCGWRGGRPL